jgi:phage terminase small subunit
MELSKEIQQWHDKIKKDYAIEDSGGLSLLMIAAESYERMRQAQEIIQSEGLIIEDRFKQKRNHPATVIEKDSRNALIQALQRLNLEVEINQIEKSKFKL